MNHGHWTVSTVTAQHAAFAGDGVSLMAYRTQD